MHLSAPLVSVVLPTFNRTESMRRAIRSVLRQSYSDWELWVVDDGSGEDIERALSDFEDQRIRFTRHPINRGAAAARNTGMDRAAGKYIAFIDSDAEWREDKLECQVRQLEANDAGIVTCGMELVSPERIRTVLPTSRGWVFDTVLRRRAGVWDTSTFLVRASTAVRFDVSFPAYQDFDFLAQVSRHFPVDTVEKVLVSVYTDTPGPRVSHCNLEGRLRVLEKYAQELAARPETLSHHHVRIALQYQYRGDMARARHHFLKALQAYPCRVQHWIWLASAALGKPVLWLALRLFRHETTR